MLTDYVYLRLHWSVDMLRFFFHWFFRLCTVRCLITTKILSLLALAGLIICKYTYVIIFLYGMQLIELLGYDIYLQQFFIRSLSDTAETKLNFMVVIKINNKFIKPFLVLNVFISSYLQTKIILMRYYYFRSPLN